MDGSNFLVTAIGSLSAEAVIASLRRLPGARIVGCNICPADWVATSSLVDAFFRIPPVREIESYLAALLEICRSERISHLIALTDVEVDVLAGCEAFEQYGVRLCLAPAGSVEIARDKLLAYRAFAADDYIATIPTWDMDVLPDGAMAYPLIAKPRLGRSSEGLIYLHGEADLLHYAGKLRGACYIVQPCLAGKVCVADVVRQKASGRCVALGREELIRTANGAGLTVRMLPDEVIGPAARYIAERLDVNGCINIEFLLHDGKARLMDINPRFSAGVAFSRLAGYDMVANHLRCFSGGPPIDGAVHPPASIYTRRYVEVVERVHAIPVLTP